MTNFLWSQLFNQQYPLWVLLLPFTGLLFGVIIVMRSQRRFLTLSLTAELQQKNMESVHLLRETERLTRELEKIGMSYHALQLEKNNAEITLARQQAQWQEKEVSYAEKLALLQAAQQALTKEFEITANRLFEDKQTQFSKLSTAQLEQIISPFHQQLRDFHQRVDDFHRQDIAQRHQLMGQISELQKQSQQIGQDAVNLAAALKGNNKALGSWGELVLERVLEQAGLQKGRDFDTQVSFSDEYGRRLQPDAVVYLPAKKQIIIDAKVSLIAYERYANSDQKELRKQALQEHVESMRAHIKNLASKQYDQLPGVNTLDFVCLFIPVESAFIAIAQNVPAVLQDAYDHKIILVSPSSLLLVLKTVESLWQRERQDHNVELIVATAGKLHDQFVRFVESMTEIGLGLDKAKYAYTRAFSRLKDGRGNLIKRAEDLQRFGAKTSNKLPSDLVRAAHEEDGYQFDESEVDR